MSYTRLCQRHTEHNDECPACRNFDQAIKQSLANYTLPPEQHPSVIAPKIRIWMKGIFGC